MKILIFSDSHGYIGNMVKAINRNKDAGMIIHLGDMVRDAIKIKELFKDIRTEFVCGNNDWSRDYGYEKILDIEEQRIFITHGHQYGVKMGYSTIISKGRAVKADMVFFGHTHQTEEIYSEGMLLINPGSISMPHMSQNPTYCLLETVDGKLKPRFMGLR